MRTSGFITSTGTSIPFPKFAGDVPNRLILQPGCKQTRDSIWQTDTIRLAYKIGRQYLANYTFPDQYTPLQGYGKNMVLDSIEIDHGPVLADVFFNYRGIIDGRISKLAPEDSISIQSMQVKDPASQAAADVTFYQPQSIWRFVTLDYPRDDGGFRSINDPYHIRLPFVVRYSVRVDPGAAPADLTPYIKDEQLAFAVERWGMFYRCTLTVARRYISPF